MPLQSSELFAEHRPLRWTVEDYHRIAETGVFDDRRVELLEGDVLEMPPIGDEHRAVSIGLIRPLLAAFGENFEVSVQSSLILSGDSEPQPDIVVARGHWRDFIDGLPLGAVVLVVEIAKTTLHTDLNRKAALYAKAGIPEYWVIDLVNSELVVHRQPLQEVSHFKDIARLKKGSRLKPLHAPDTSLLVDDLLL